MARNNPPQGHVADRDLPKPQDQGQDIAMVDATSDSAPHGGQDQDSHPDKEPPPNPEALGPGDQEGQQQPPDPADMNRMQMDVAPTIIERLECQQLLHRIGFFLDAEQAIVHDHG